MQAEHHPDNLGELIGLMKAAEKLGLDYVAKRASEERMFFGGRIKEPTYTLTLGGSCERKLTQEEVERLRAAIEEALQDTIKRNRTGVSV